MILIDNNQIVIAYAFRIIKQESELDISMLRHMILNSYRIDKYIQKNRILNILLFNKEFLLLINLIV
jgi:hypothetical protein